MKLAVLASLPLLALAACATVPPAAAPTPGPLADAPAAPAPVVAEVPPPAPAVAPAPPPPPAPEPPTSACNDQPPQDFLVRKNFLREPGGREKAIAYRNETYGYYAPPGTKAPKGALPAPNASVVTTTFMSLPVRMHKKVVPALACAEAEIKRTCADHPYTAHALAGIRFKNTYRGGEVTNHIYGTAIDVDPARNTCCGCVPPWNDAPRCHAKAKTEYDRMEMPECWVHAFERFGFYWLGHDVLQDTMHFEFLGDPDRIVRVASPPPATSPDAGK